MEEANSKGQGCPTLEVFAVHIWAWAMLHNARLHFPQPQPLGPEVSFVISLWQFVGFGFVLRARGRGIPEGTFTCSEVATPAALDSEYWHIRKLLFP